MSENLLKLDAAIRKEADDLLRDKGLASLLAEYGTVHVAGSYALRLMVWRDLDIYLEAEDLSLAAFFELGAKLAARLNPMRMMFRNHRRRPHETGLRSLYWGIRLGDIHQGAWKIDIHAMDSKTCSEQLDKGRQLASRLTEQTRLSILDIKSQCWRHPLFRKEFTSHDIYTAVLQEGVTDMEGFRRYMAGRGIAVD